MLFATTQGACSLNTKITVGRAEKYCMRGLYYVAINGGFEKAYKNCNDCGKYCAQVTITEALIAALLISFSLE
ncbi:hypothetical protein CU098_009613 [Rhizopus stolonifer]|uniref:Uncharacterized protein n=1 Tax=Rhizopus stolonifer TaxID=4846 RepID=A0A367KTP0_RHIST|nr:hypothetical protein CU098_009613 [Rhizopus stolonifer]